MMRMHSVVSVAVFLFHMLEAIRDDNVTAVPGTLFRLIGLLASCRTQTEILDCVGLLVSRAIWTDSNMQLVILVRVLVQRVGDGSLKPPGIVVDYFYHAAFRPLSRR